MKEKGYTTDILTRYAVELLGRPRSRPLCLWLPHKAVHPELTQPAERHKAYMERVDFDGATRKAKVIFSISDPTTGAFWNIKSDAPFKAGGASTLRVDIGWNTTEFLNTGGVRENLSTVIDRSWPDPSKPPSAIGASYPIVINALTPATAAPRCTNIDCPGLADINLRFRVSATLPAQANGTARVANDPRHSCRR